MSYHYRLMGLLALIAITLILWMSAINKRLNFECKPSIQPLTAMEVQPSQCMEKIHEIVSSKETKDLLIASIRVDDKFLGVYWLLFCGMGLLLSQAATTRCNLSSLGGFTIALASAAALIDYYENRLLLQFLQSSWSWIAFRLDIHPVVVLKWLFVFATIALISILLLLHPRRIKHLGWIFLAASITGLFGTAGLGGYFHWYKDPVWPLTLGSLFMFAGLLLLTVMLLSCPQEFVYRKIRKSGNNKRPESDNVKNAKRILRGNYHTPAKILEIAKKLMDEKQFGYARKILRRARADQTIHLDPKLRLDIGQSQSVCTYKDPDLPTDLKLERALQILREVDNLAETQNKETLGQAGSIFKRKWEYRFDRDDLETSLNYYRRGANTPLAEDQGWNRINAAFVLDLLAAEEISQARKSGIKDIDKTRLNQAKEIREALVSKVSELEKLEKSWWLHATIAEAYFGLANYEEAKRRIKEAPSAPDWKKESTARQFASLAKVQKLANEKINESAMRAVITAIAEDPDAVESSVRGRIGLALSGGGFRASLYHIGVLAKLAELDLLRDVEVLSCVSGGSIIGAHYYLALKQLLEDKADSEITREHYIEVIQHIEKDFLDGVKKNIRTRVILNPWKTFKMMFSTYSRTNRAGELMEKHLFRRTLKKNGDPARSSEFWITNLTTVPKGEPSDFNPKTNNWKRKAKVPILVLNATTLNTGHNWHFTATYMGEPPGNINTEVDGNYRFRRVYYDDAPEEYQQIRLGTAVGASAAVPGVFEPIVLPNLYPDKTVLLADGGVQDNQGIGALLEQDCSILLVSDASGQMDAVDQPGSGILNVLLRSNSILQARLRDLEYRELLARQQSSQLRSMMFIHLKKDLDTDPIDWAGSQDRYEASDNARPASRRGTHTSYGILKDIQRALSAIRTDLDSFCEAEAYALMFSGYRMTKVSLPESLKPKNDQDQTDLWKFTDIEKPMTDAYHPAYPYLKRVLEVGANPAFKIWHLSCILRMFTGIIALAIILYTGWIVAQNWNEEAVFNIRIGSVAYWLLTILFFAIAGFILDLLMGRLGKDFIQAIDIRSTIKRILFAIVGAVFGWIIALIHLSIFDRWFLKRGSLDAVLKGKYPIC